ncbi:MAG: ATP-dependent DNA helicase RecQ [Saprospiraceae bacterium]
MAETYFDILRRYWGYPVFRGQQESIIQGILDEQDLLAVLPTGSGKSICYQIPALMRPGLTLVISPLIALMENQVDQCKQRSIPAGALHGGMDFRDQRTVLDQAMHGRIKLLYVAPERLAQDRFLQFLADLPQWYLMVDEAHCISQWGHDFRPAYLQIIRAKEIKPDLQIAAFTATATKEVISDINQQLGLRSPRTFRDSIAKPNLHSAVVQSANKWSILLDKVRKTKGTQIIYVRSRNRTETVSRYLSQRGIASQAYHAGMPYDRRIQTQEDWIRNRVQVIVATTAFGMGIDKADVRQVIHLDIPETLEEYVQEVGRAGRDGKPAEAVLLFNEEDVDKNVEHLRDQFPDFPFIRQTYKAIGQYLELAVGGGDERKPVDWAAFALRFKLPIRPLMTAIRILELNGYILHLDGWYKPSMVQFLISKESLYEQELPEELQEMIQALLRNYENIFLYPQRISEGKLTTYLGIPKPAVEDLLHKLEQLEVISYQPSTDLPLISIPGERLPVNDLVFDRESYQQLVDRKYEQWNAMHQYLFLQSNQCREQFIGIYFDEQLPRCGHCDLCLTAQISLDVREVWQKLQQDAWTLAAFVDSYAGSHQEKVLEHLSLLESEQWIWIDGDRNIHLNGER